MKIVADHGKCEGLGMCEAMSHEFFEVGEDGFVTVLDETPADEHRDLVLSAVDSCPVSALRLEG